MGVTSKAETLTIARTWFDEIRAKLAQADSDLKFPPQAFYERALDGMVKANGKLYANPRAFDDAPLASCTHRMLRWHRSGGSLWTAMIVSDHCRLLAGTKDADVCEGLDSGQIFDYVDTIARALNGFRSPACARWNKALYGRE